MANKTVIKLLVDNDLKVTPQRIGVLEVLLNFKSHLTAENIIDYLRISYPHIQPGTVYKILGVFTKKGLVTRVNTANDVIRFDAITEKHHHLYCSDSDRIEDFYDENLNKIINEYLKMNRIPNFQIEDIKLQIVGKFN